MSLSRRELKISECVRKGTFDYEMGEFYSKLFEGV